MFLLVQHLMFDPVSSCGFAIACHRVHSPPRAKVINQTALFFAARKGHSETIQYLLKQGADPNIVDVHGETALLGCQQGCLFWSEDGGQKFAEWAVCSLCRDCEGHCSEIVSLAAL
jgi:NAD-dependent dihydropyrimidine dehydrogenase PreA subunit